MVSTHSAAGSAIGYQYQADYCLLALLNDGGPGRGITLELHDDVAWEEAGSPTQRLQIKHIVRAKGGLGDKAPEIWKTILAWLEDGQAANPDGPSLMLVSTGSASENSAAHLLKDSKDRNPVLAATKLRKAASESTTTSGPMVTAFEAFRKLGVAGQNSFASRITVVDGEPLITDIADTVRSRIWTHLPPDISKHPEFLDQLWGWWRGRVVEMLTHRYFPNDETLRPSVSSGDLNAKLVQLTVSFSDHGLPEFSEFDVDDDDTALIGLDREPFVHQLEMVNLHDRVVRKAIVDYFRATHSEVRWLERDFLRSDDVQRYERKLKDAWEVLYGMMLSDLPDDASDEQETAAGRNLLNEILTKPAIRIRDQVDQDFYYRGKHHMMAQVGDLGWHPNFEAEVKRLLVGGAGPP